MELMNRMKSRNFSSRASALDSINANPLTALMQICTEGYQLHAKKFFFFFLKH